MRHVRPICRWSLCTIVALSAMGDGDASAQADEVVITDKARVRFQQGVALLEDPAGPRYAEAYEAFKAAYEESPSRKILGNIGLCAAELERYGEAIDAYRRYLEASDVDPEERAQIETELKRIEDDKAELSLSGITKGSRIVDERRPPSGRAVINRYGPYQEDEITLRLRAGEHQLRIEAPDGRTASITVTLARSGSESRAFAWKGASDGGERTEAEPTFPVPHVLRPLTLPEHVLAPALGFHLSHFPGAGGVGVGLDLLTASFGILDWLQVDAALLPLEVTPEVDYSTASAGITARYLDAVVELGSSLRLGHFRPIGERHFFVEPGFIEALFHLGDWGRLDTAFRLSFISRNPVTVGMRVPIRMALQPVDVFFLGAATGIGMQSFDLPGETLFIPLGAFAGFTVPSEHQGDDGAMEDRPIVDVEARFGFDQLFVPGAPSGSGQDKVDPATYTGLLAVRVYLQL